MEQATQKRLQDFNSLDKGVVLSLDERSRLPDQMLLRVKGYLDNENAGAFQDLMKSFLQEDVPGKTLLLDLDGMSYASSTGLGALTGLLILCREKGVELKLLHIRPKVHSVMDLLGFTSFFSISESLDQALVGSVRS